jgi:hypothetical protein
MSQPFRRLRSHRVLVAIVALGVAVGIAAPIVAEASEASPDHDVHAAKSATGVPQGAQPLLVPANAAVAGTQGSQPAPTEAASVAGAQCGVRSGALISAVDAAVAQRIYAGEVSGREPRLDQTRVRTWPALLKALASGNRAATYAATYALVYKPHWHIVRLRVLKAGHVMADVGGPYITAPIYGTLSWHGRTVGSYVMSVQDDLGYQKLVSRFIGVPIDLYRGASFVMGTLNPAPALPRQGAVVTRGSTSYAANTLAVQAFPSGVLNAALFVPAPSHAQQAMNCQSVQAAAWGSVAMHIASRFTPLSAHYKDLAGVVRAATGASVFVVSGKHQLAGGKMPRGLPTSGAVTFQGHSRGVFSWTPAPGVRVYVLSPS